MKDQPMLSEDEWALVIELLRQEREELPAEIRHTRTSSVRADLHERRDLIDRLLDKLHKAVALC